MNKKLMELLNNKDILCLNCEIYKNKFLKVNKNIHFYSIDEVEKIQIREFSTIIGVSENILLLQKIFWKFQNLNNLIIIGANNLKEIKERKSKYQNIKLWDMIAYKSEDDISCGGWFNSYNKEKFSKEEMNEFVFNVEEKLKKYLNNDKIVLEIGCSSGLTMFHISPKVKKYIGTDFSKEMIKKDLEKIKIKKINNIELQCIAADAIDMLDIYGIDLVIINSVIQLFDGYCYFYRFFDKLLKMLKNNSIIFIGDVMDLKKEDDLLLSVIDYKKKNNCNATKIDFSNDLFFSKDFFLDLEYGYNVKVLDISKKKASIKNELTKYRYDVVLQYNKNFNKKTDIRYKNQYCFKI